MPVNDNLKLRIEIGRLLGYEAVQIPDDDEAAARMWWVNDPDGNPVEDGGWVCPEKTADEAWSHAPNWPEDIGAAMALLNDPRIIRWNIFGPVATVSRDAYFSVMMEAKTAASACQRGWHEAALFALLPLAICLAWIESVSGEAWKGGADDS